jgi:hypothetical protein
MAKKQDAQEASKKPAYERRFGSIRLAVWANQKDDGQVRYNTTITRSYRNGNTWEDTASFSRDELPIVVIAAVVAFFWIWNRPATPQQEQETEA